LLERENRELKRALDLLKANVERERSTVDARLRAIERRLPASR
jgi:hypothetical protein